MNTGVSVLLVLILIACAVVMLLLWRRSEARGRALQEALAAARTELEKYAPIKQIDEEVVRRRIKLEAEITGLSAKIEQMRKDMEEEAARRRKSLEDELTGISGRLQTTREELAVTEARLREYELRLDLEEMGFYQPKFVFEDVQQYADALDLVREAQKEMVRQKAVVTGVGDRTAGVRGLGKLAVSAFNGEARTIIEDVSYDSFEASKEKLRVAFERINNLLEGFGIAVAAKYLEFKVKEMALAYDYEQAEQKAKEEQAQLKEMIREEEDAREEAERAREKAMREERQYQEALEAARAELASKSAEERATYEQQIQQLEAKLTEATAERERATSMAQITKKGHVYIISNVGSFGERVFKIGLTRRLEPRERIRELGDASVPFGFDVHALISADDAPALEAALHGHFAGRQMNKVNPRKEFFRVSIDEIAQACEILGCKVQLTRLAEAREYKATLAMEAEIEGGTGGDVSGAGARV